MINWISRVGYVFSFVFIFLVLFNQYVYADILFFDNFNTGIDTTKWYLETVNGARWIYAEEGGNGYITTMPQGNWNNRYVDILSQKDDFSDFILSYDIRFRSSSWHRDWRNVYLRGDISSNVYGYGMYVGVNVPVGPHPHIVQFAVHKPDGSTASLGDGIYDKSWDLNQWYRFKIYLVNNNFKVKWWEQGALEPIEWFLETSDPDKFYSKGRIGFGNYWRGVTDIDNVKVETPDVVPEPMSLLMFGIGIIGMWRIRRMVVV